MTNTERFDLLVKVQAIGDSGIGKTCLLLRYVEKKFQTSHLATIGIDFKIKCMETAGKKLKMQIWDTAGQDRFESISTTFYKGAHGILLCYSIIDRKSFENVARWMNIINQHAPKNVSIVLAATKCDLAENRQVDFSEGEELAKKYNLKFLEVSSFENSNVSEQFELLAQNIVKIKQETGAEDDLILKKDKVKSKSKKCGSC